MVIIDMTTKHNNAILKVLFILYFFQSSFSTATLELRHQQEEPFRDLDTIQRQNHNFRQNGGGGEYCLFRYFAISFPPKPILIKHGRVRLGHNRITRKILAFSAKIQFLFFHTITGKAISRGVFFLATTTTAFYVCRASTAVKAAFAK